jgi:hypothetical protein
MKSIFENSTKVLETTETNDLTTIKQFSPMCPIGTYEGTIISTELKHSIVGNDTQYNKLSLDIEINGIIEDVVILNTELLKNFYTGKSIYLQCEEYTYTDKNDNTRVSTRLGIVSKVHHEKYQKELKKELELVSL